MVESIDSTLQENRFHAMLENDQEVVEEERRLLEVMSFYPEKAAAERASMQASRKENPPTNSNMDMTTLPVFFDSTSNHPFDGCTLGKRCSLCSPERMGSKTRELTSNRKRFREIEFDPMDFGALDEVTDKRGVSRRGREIVLQRAASLLLLSEIKHTLQFISKYNEGFDQRPTFSLDSKLGGKPHNLEPSKKAPREVPGKTMDGRKPQSHADAAEHSPGCTLVLETLSHAGIIEDLHHIKQSDLRRKCGSSSLDESMSSLQSNILETIAEQPRFDLDEDDMEEHKSYTRAIRTYNGKADQERIERREHEEQRELQLRELHYKNRGKKRSAEEQELLNLESRPILFPSSEMDETSPCQFGPTCMVCEGAYEEHSNYRSESIFLPSVKRTDADFFDEDVTPGSRRSRTKIRSMQREVAVEKLNSLHHRLCFVARYNDGWINTDRRML